MTSDRIRYKRLGYVVLNVADVARSRTFYEKHVGLAFVGQSPKGDVYLRCSDLHHDLVLTKSERPGVRRIGWQMESADALAALRESCRAAGIACSDVPVEEGRELHTDGGFRAVEPSTGAEHEFYVRMAFSDSPFEPTHTRITTLGHIVLGTPALAASENFYYNVMNFKQSDRIADAVVHMRCFPNPLHHTFGLGATEKPTMNHLTFNVKHIDDIGRAGPRMEAAGVPVVYGPGRHPQSGSIFFYFLDPDGLTIEYSQGMEEFPEDNPREPRRFVLEGGSLDYWDGKPKPGFTEVGAVG